MVVRRIQDLGYDRRNEIWQIKLSGCKLQIQRLYRSLVYQALEEIYIGHLRNIDREDTDILQVLRHNAITVFDIESADPNGGKI